MTAPLPPEVLDQLFRQARTVHAFDPAPVDDVTIHQLYDLLKWGPTAFNAQPARYLFLRSPEAKARLGPALSSGNRDKTLAAPLVAIIAYDARFHEHLPEQFPAFDAKPLFDDNPALAEQTAVRNGSLQGAYLILAARALGLDVGPMSGFNPARVNEEFFPDGRYRVNFIASLGVGIPASAFPRGPRLDFDVAARVL
jgi:3-hydroxypropanoate dehydrogenase